MIDLSKFKQGETLSAEFTLIGMQNTPIKKSQWNNEGKWSIQVMNHPTSGSGNIAVTDNELKVLAGKLGLSSGATLLQVLGAGFIKVNTVGTVNKAKAKYVDIKDGQTKAYLHDHVRFNVNDYVLTPDADVVAFCDKLRFNAATEQEKEARSTASDDARKLRTETLMRANKLAPAKEVAEI